MLEIIILNARLKHVLGQGPARYILPWFRNSKIQSKCFHLMAVLKIRGDGTDLYYQAGRAHIPASESQVLVHESCQALEVFLAIVQSFGSHSTLPKSWWLSIHH